MQGVKYFLVVVAAVAGLSIATRLVYLQHPDFKEPVAAEETPASPTPTPLAKPAEARPATVTRAGSTVQPKPAAARRSPRRTTAAPQPAPDALVTTDSAPGVVALPPAAAPDTVLPPPPEPAWQATPRQLVRDSAYVMARSGRLQAAIDVLDSWVRVNPADSAIALDLARLRARAGDWEGSIAQYSALIEQNRTPELLHERGQTYLWSGDTRRGEADLLESERMAPRAATERQLGDHYRWQGDFAKSASWYQRALRSEPGDTAAQNGMHLLDRAIDARLLMPGELAGGDFGSGMQATSDNAGFGFYALRLSQAFGSAPVLTLSGELRSANSMSTTGESQVDAYGIDAAVSRRIGASKFTATLGMLDHGNDARIVRGAVTADGFAGNARLRAALRRTPAYEPLWAPRLLGAAGSPATALQAQGSVSLPLGRAAELYAMGEHLAVSDDNSRVAASVALRQRLPSSFSLVYSGSMMSYDQQTSLYYSPARYLSQSLGLEFGRYREQGFSYVVRATPGYAWMREPAGTADSTTRDLSAFQFTSGLELGYRRGAWDLLLSTGLSAGREGGYRSQNALFYLRRSW